MLTTAAILMSLGTEPVNSHHVSSEPIDTGGGSFAKSFDEGVALVGEVQLQIVDGKTSQNTGDAKSNIAAQKTDALAVAGTGTKVNVDARIRSDLSGTASLIVGTGVDKTATASGGAKVAAAAVGSPQGEGTKESASHVSADVQSDVSTDEFSAGSIQNTSQKLPPAEVDASKMGVAEGMVAPPIDIVASTTLLLLGNSQTTVVLNQKETEIVEKAPATPIKKTAKSEDGVGKTAKNEKTVAIAGNTSGIETQIQLMIAVPGIVPSMEVQSSKASTTQDDVGVSLLADTFTTTGQGNGLFASVGRPDKASMGAAKMDAANVKGAAVAAVNDPALLKTDPDTAKTAKQPETSEAGGGAKGQGIVAVLAPVQPRTESGIVSGVVVSAPAAHIISEKSQSESLSSSVGSMQVGVGTPTGPGAVDSGGPIDATHKTLTASPTTLEVGVPNGTHGWLKIRAEMTGAGGVNASLSTASTSGQEMLHRELPALTAYLESERVAVNTVVVQPAVTAGTDFRGLAGGMNGDGRGQAQQSGSQGREHRQDTTGTALSRAEDIRAYVGANGLGVDDLLSPASYAGGGSWLSVRA